MALANAVVKNFGNHLIGNLNVLASFDKCNDIRQQRGSRLNIHQDGRFEKGGFFSIFIRNDSSSLSQAYNQQTVNELISQAIDKLCTDTSIRDASLRKAIFNGIRGARWLLSAYQPMQSATTINVNTTNSNITAAVTTSPDTATASHGLKELDDNESKFRDVISKAVFRFDQFHQIYSGSQPIDIYSGGMGSFMNNSTILGNGICAGVSLHWLSRWVIRGKSSILDSKKTPNLSADYALYRQNADRYDQISRQLQALENDVNNREEEIKREVEVAIAKYSPAVWQQRILHYKTELKARQREVRKMAERDPVFREKLDLISTKLNELNVLGDQYNEILRSIMQFRKSFEERLLKKGGEMTVLYREQSQIKKGDKFDNQNPGNPTRSIQTTVRQGYNGRFDAIERIMIESMDENIKKSRRDANLEKLKKYQIEKNQIENAFQYNNEVRNQQENRDIQGFLDHIADKNANAMTSRITKFELGRSMYFRDCEDFKESVEQMLRPLVAESDMNHQQNKRIGYYIRWNAGISQWNGKYQFGDKSVKITDDGGHAMAFHKTSNGSFLAFDPNCGEVECQDGTELINQFSRWFSFYSLSTSIKEIGYMKVSDRRDQS